MVILNEALRIWFSHEQYRDFIRWQRCHEKVSNRLGEYLLWGSCQYFRWLSPYKKILVFHWYQTKCPHFLQIPHLSCLKWMHHTHLKQLIEIRIRDHCSNMEKRPRVGMLMVLLWYFLFVVHMMKNYPSMHTQKKGREVCRWHSPIHERSFTQKTGKKKISYLYKKSKIIITYKIFIVNIYFINILIVKYCFTFYSIFSRICL